MTPLRFTSLVVRLCAIALVAVSPWLQPSHRPSDTRSVVYVVDRSASMGSSALASANLFVSEAWAEAHGSVGLGVVAFDATAELVAPVGTKSAPAVREGKDAASDLAAGLRLAQAALPMDGHRSIVLLSDARPTRGDAVSEVRRAYDHGIRVDVVPLGSEPSLDPIVTALHPRATHVAEHQPVVLDVDIEARPGRRIDVRWSRDGVPLPRTGQYIQPAPDGSDDTRATERATLVDQNPPPGIHVYDVKISSDYEGRDADGPSSLAVVSVEGKAQALVFSSTGDVPPVLRSALGELGLEARLLPIDRTNDPSSYSGADLVVLNDVRVSGAATDDTGLTRTAQTAMVDYVNQGGGLFVTGGVFGLAPEYSGTPLARALPVEIEDRGHVEDPPVALAIMLDRSGSMSATVGAHTKIELAIEASLSAADVLRPTDQVALASVDTQTNWDVPLGPVERLAGLRDQVRRVTADGGGIYVYTALRDAYAALRPVKTPIRHVILFSDTSDSEEQIDGCVFDPCSGGRTAESLAREARTKGITTTVVGIGDEEAQHTPFLRRLAAAAGGRFYLTAEGSDLRRIFLSETRVLAQSNLREKKAAVFAAGPHPVLEGVDPRKLPETGAYVETGRRSGADTALLIDDPARPGGRPMLATWRYGLGKVGTLTTDLMEGWGGAWAASPVAAQVLKQTLRALLRQSNARRADAHVQIRDRVVEVELELPPDAPAMLAPKTIEVNAIEKGGQSRKIAMLLEQRGPGHWFARGRSAGEPIMIVRARDERGALIAEAVGQEDRISEHSAVGVDLRFAEELARVGEGRVRPTIADSLDLTPRPGRALRASWPLALIAAAGLVVLDLLLRRLGERRARGPRVARIPITAA